MPSGGKREGAGRPKGNGVYGESTQVMRVPVSAVADIQLILLRCKSKQT